jgi:hypothetical protein
MGRAVCAERDGFRFTNTSTILLILFSVDKFLDQYQMVRPNNLTPQAEQVTGSAYPRKQNEAQWSLPRRFPSTPSVLLPHGTEATPKP